MNNDIEKAIQTLEFNYKDMEGLINHYKKRNRTHEQKLIFES